MFDAFISYSHAADGKLAPALQQGLQGFAKPWYRRRALRIFRDQTSLAASPELWPTIVRGLESSRYFLLLASPEAAASRWVRREVSWWLEHRSPQHLLIVLTGGDLVWDETSGDFDWTRTDALPDELRGAFATEPLWVDLRWAKSAEDLSSKNPAFLAAVADLAATIRGVPKDELVGEDIRQHRRTRQTAAAAIVALVLLTLAAVGAGLAALGQRNEAVRQEGVAVAQAATAEAERARAIDAQSTAEAERGRAVDAQSTAEAERTVAVSRQLASQARLLQDEHFDTALLLAVEAFQQSPTVEAEQALLALLGARPALERYLWSPQSSRSTVAYAAGDEKLISAGTSVDLWDLHQGEIVASLPANSNADIGFTTAVSKDETTLAVGGCLVKSQEGGCERGSLQIYAADSLAPLSEPIPAHGGPVVAIAFSEDGSRLATASWDNTIWLWDVAARRPVATFASGVEEGVGRVSLGFSQDGTRLAVGGPNLSMASGGAGIRIWDISNDHPTEGALLPHDRGVIDVTFVNFDDQVVGASESGLYRWYLDDPLAQPEPLLAGVNVTGLAVHRPTALLFAVDLDGAIHFLDISSGEVLGAVTDGETNSGAPDVAVSDDGLHVAVQSGRAVALWNWESTELRRDLFTGAAEDLRLAGWASDALLRVQEDSARVITLDATLAGDDSPDSSSDVEIPVPEDGLLVVAGSNGPRFAWFISGETSISVADNPPSPPRTIETGALVRNLALTTDGSRLVAVLDDDSVRLWNAQNLDLLATATPLGVDPGPLTQLGQELAVSPSGNRIAVTDSLSGEITILELPSLQPALPTIELQPLTGMALDMAFTSDGQALIVAGTSGSRADSPELRRQSNISRWDLSRDQAVGSVLTDGMGTRTLAISPNDHWLAYTGSYYTETDVYLWDLQLGAGLGFLAREDGASALAFSPDSERLAVGASGYEIAPRLAVYAVDVEAWRTRACRIAARELTPDEWRYYLGNLPQRPTCGIATAAAATPVA